MTKPTMPASNGSTIISIGRGPSNDVVLQDSNISTSHARLIVEEDRIVLEDLGSTNGTSIGSVENKISRGTVEPSDTVFFGSSSFLVSDLIQQSLPSHVAPVIESKREPRSPSSASTRVVALAAATGGVLLFLVGVGWMMTREPTDPTLAQNNTPDAVGDGSGSTLAADGMTQTPKSSNDVPAATTQVEASSSEEISSTEVASSPPTTLSPEEKFERSIFLIVCADRERETPFRVGTAFAIDANTVVTSASLIQSMLSLQAGDYPDAFLFSPVSDTEWQITSTILHPKYESAEQAVQQAGQAYDAIYDGLGTEPKPEAVEAVKDQLIDASAELFAALDRKSMYDVAIIKTTDSLDHWLPEVSIDSTLRPRQKVNVTGYAIDMQDRFLDRTVPFELSTMTSRIDQLVSGTQSSDRRLVANGNGEQEEYAYLGSPVLNAQGQVIGVYTRSLPSIPGSEDQPAYAFDAALLDRVKECRQ